MASFNSIIALTLFSLALFSSVESEMVAPTESPTALQVSLTPVQTVLVSGANTSSSLLGPLNWDNLTLPWPIMANLTAPLNTSLLLANLTHQFQELQNSTLAQSLYNMSGVTAQAGQAVVTEALVRPLTFFLGQNIRLLSDGIQQLGSAINHSGYHLSSFESALYNTSQALSHYGMNLVNASVNFRPTQ